MILEARCARCSETFNPHTVDELEHYAREDGEECGGTGELLGAWCSAGEVPPWAAEEPWVDRHEVVVPPPCSLDRAFDGEAEPQRRELHALERDVLCRLLSDVLHRVRVTQSLDSLVWAGGYGGVRLSAWELPLLENVWEAIQPRAEQNW